MRGRGGVFLGACLRVVWVVPLGLADARFFSEVFIITYRMVLAAASCLSVELLLVAANARASNCMSSCSMSDWLPPPPDCGS